MSRSKDWGEGFYRAARLIPEANKDAIHNTALFAKEQFIRGGVAAGLTPGGTLPRDSGRKWGAGYDVKGSINATALIRYYGPLQLVLSPTRSHIIAARLLGTRKANSGKYLPLLRNRLDGKSNRGMFGKRQEMVAYNRYGSYRQQARQGTLRRRKGKKALVIPGAGTPKAYAFHPGTRGKNTWPSTVASIRAGAPVTFSKSYRRALLRAFH